MSSVFSLGPAPGLPFVGWAHLSIRDSDGHSRQIKGSSVQTPLLATLSPDGKSVIVEAELVVSNPLSFIRITNEDNYYFTTSFIMGSCHHGHRALDHILLQTIPVACTQFKDLDELEIECFIPFVKGQNNRAKMTVSLVEHKLVTKVSKLRTTIPVSVFSEVYLYRDSLIKYKKLETGDEEKGDGKASPSTTE
jgi:hypothetical protein